MSAVVVVGRVHAVETSLKPRAARRFGGGLRRGRWARGPPGDRRPPESRPPDRRLIVIPSTPLHGEALTLSSADPARIPTLVPIIPPGSFASAPARSATAKGCSQLPA